VIWAVGSSVMQPDCWNSKSGGKEKKGVLTTNLGEISRCSCCWCDKKSGQRQCETVYFRNLDSRVEADDLTSQGLDAEASWLGVLVRRRVSLGPRGTRAGGGTHLDAGSRQPGP